MAFCTKCGAAMAEGSRFCPACGAENTPVAAGAYQAANTGSQGQAYQTGQNGAYQSSGPQYQAQNGYQAPGGAYGAPGGGQGAYQNASPSDHTAQFHPQDIANNKVMGVLSYLGILVLVPLLTQSAKQSPYARFHANQGLILFLAQIAWNIIRTIILTVMVNVVYSYGVYHLCNILFTLLSIALGVFSLIGLIFAAQGKARELPVIGKLHLLK